ncbi:MAG: maltose operon protein [Psychromonas sp.]|uniref:MalM family protein n=1 Tax=Psychromonas sp. TaxID=1884585 RepID=UPI0039E4BBEF
MAIKIAVSSPMVASVFVPTILILEEQHKPLQLYSEETIKYDSGSLLNVDRLFANIELPAAFADGRRAKYLLVLTTEETMQGITTLAPPKQSEAEVGRADLVYKMHRNEPLPHTATGVVRLAFDYKPSSRTSATGIVAKTPTDSKKAQSMVAAESIVAATASEAVINNSIQPESEAMFLTLIEQAVKEGDYKKALRFVEEAELAGSTKARDALIKAMKKYQ